MQAIRERMVELDFEEGFIDKTLKEYSVEKIERKLDLLMERRNIQNPAGWLKTALTNDYPTPHPHLNPPPSRGRKLGERERGNPKHVNLNSQIPSPLEGKKQENGFIL